MPSKWKNGYQSTGPDIRASFNEPNEKNHSLSPIINKYLLSSLPGPLNMAFNYFVEKPTQLEGHIFIKWSETPPPTLWKKIFHKVISISIHCWLIISFSRTFRNCQGANLKYFEPLLVSSPTAACAWLTALLPSNVLLILSFVMENCIVPHFIFLLVIFITLTKL